MPFDPNKPFEAAETPSEKSSGFDATAPFETVEAPKPTKPSKIVGNGLGGAVMPADLEALKSQIDVSTGLLSGVAQSGVGVGQFFSDLGKKTARGQAAEKGMALTPQQAKERKETEDSDKWTQWAKSLKDFGDPTAQHVGKVVGDVGLMMLGNEAAGALGVGELLAPVAQRVSPYVPEFAKSGYEWLKGAKTTQAVAGEAAATTTEALAISEAKAKLDTVDIILQGLKAAGKELAKTAVIGVPSAAGGGAAIGTIQGAVEPRTEETQEKRDAARWEAVKDGFKGGTEIGAYFGLVGGTIGLLGEFGKFGWEQMTTKQRKEAVAKSEEAINFLKQKLGEKVFSGQAKAEAQVEAAEKAVAAGFLKDSPESKAFIAKELERNQQAALDAKGLVEGFKKEQTQTKASFGTYVKEKLLELRTALEKSREDKAEFKAALKNAPEGNVVDTSPLVQYIDNLLGSNEFRPSSSTRKMLQNIRSDFVEEVEVEVLNAEGELEKAVEFVPKKIPIAQANTTRQEFNHMATVRNLEDYGVNAVSSRQLRELQNITELLNDAAGEAHAPYMEAVKTWREESRHLDRYRVGGFSGIGEADQLSGQNVQLGADILKSVLQQARAGDKELAALINKDKEFETLAKDYFLGELLAGGDIKKNTFNSFYNKNRDLLEQVPNIKNYFQELEKKYQAGQFEIEEARQALKTKTVRRDEITKETKQAATDLKKAKDLEDASKILLGDLSRATEPSEVFTKYNEIVSSLKKKDLITAEQLNEYKDLMKVAYDDYKLNKNLEQFDMARRKAALSLGFAGATGFAATTYGVGHALRETTGIGGD